MVEDIKKEEKAKTMNIGGSKDYKCEKMEERQNEYKKMQLKLVKKVKLLDEKVKHKQC